VCANHEFALVFHFMAAEFAFDESDGVLSTDRDYDTPRPTAIRRVQGPVADLRAAGADPHDLRLLNAERRDSAAAEDCFGD
jgi:hypothetical protein